MDFPTALKNYGLSDKEAAVYLAALELGPSSVQNIGRRARVVRSTTYPVLEALMARGLVSQLEKGKRTLFAAESPRHLEDVLEKESDSLQHRRQSLGEILPALLAMARGSEEKPTVRYFEGLAGLRVMRTEMTMYANSKDTWYQFTPVDHLIALFGEVEATYFRSRAAKGVRSKTLFTTKSEALRKNLETKSRRYLSEMKFVPTNKFLSSSGMTIYRDRIAIGSFVGAVGGVIIESPAMASMMRELFLLLWEKY